MQLTSITSQNQQHLMSTSNVKASNAYRMYLAVKLHFMTDKYDITINRGHVKMSKAKFDERNQYSLYEKFANKFETKQQMAQYLIANFAYGAWGNTDIIYGTSEADANFKEWIRRKESMTQIFKNDLSKIRLLYDKENVKFKQDIETKQSIPYLFQLYLGNHITLETMVILDTMHPILGTLKENVGRLFDDEIRRIAKAKPFVKFDIKKVTPIFEEFSKEY